MDCAFHNYEPINHLSVRATGRRNKKQIASRARGKKRYNLCDELTFMPRFVRMQNVIFISFLLPLSRPSSSLNLLSWVRLFFVEIVWPRIHTERVIYQFLVVNYLKCIPDLSKATFVGSWSEISDCRCTYCGLPSKPADRGTWQPRCITLQSGRLTKIEGGKWDFGASWMRTEETRHALLAHAKYSRSLIKFLEYTYSARRESPRGILIII